MIKVMLANNNHIDDLVLLNAEVQEMHSKKYPLIFKYPIDSSLVKDDFITKLANKHHLIYVALKGQMVVGYIWAQYIERAESALTYSAKKIKIHHIAVSKQERGEGIGDMLMGSINIEAQKRTVQHIALDVWCFNNKAESFFKKSGYEVFNINMWKL